MIQKTCFAFVVVLACSACSEATKNQELYDALMAEDTALLDAKLTQGADVNSTRLDGWSPLPFSVANHKDVSTAWLLENGADVNSMDGGGNTALFWAVKTKDDRILRLLLDKGADPCRAESNGETAVAMAMAYGDVRLVQRLGRCVDAP
jgi:ankyrin repeat protein